MSDSSIALKPVTDEPSKPMPSSSAPSTSPIVIEKLFRCPSRSVNQSSMSSMPVSLIAASTRLRAAGSDVARFLLSTCAMASSSLDRRGVYCSAEGYARGCGRGASSRALADAVSRRRRAVVAVWLVAPRGRRLVRAPPGRPPVGRRLGGAGEPVAARLGAPRPVPRRHAADVHGARHRPGRAAVAPAADDADRSRATRRCSAGTPVILAGGRAALLPVALRGRDVELDRRGDEAAAPARRRAHDR